jgi:hypothetical protein
MFMPPMKEVHLTRFAYTPMGVFGRLRVTYTTFECFTVERPWLDNQRNVSCIPTGNYRLLLTTHYGRPGPTDDYPAYQLLAVPKRSLIKIHRGNTMHDLKGCIAPGKKLGCIWVDDRHVWGVQDSTIAHRDFIEAMGGIKECWIVVRNDNQGRMRDE